MARSQTQSRPVRLGRLVRVRIQKPVNLPDRCKVKSLCIGPRQPLFLGLPAECGQHFGFKVMQVVARDGLARRDCDCIAVADFKHAAAHGNVVFGARPTAPSRD